MHIFKLCLQNKNLNKVNIHITNTVIQHVSILYELKHTT